MSALLQQLNVELDEVVVRVRRSLVQVRSGDRGAGAGTIWHPNGLVVTNAHVVRSRRLRVTLPDGTTRPRPAPGTRHQPRLGGPDGGGHRPACHRAR